MILIYENLHYLVNWSNLVEFWISISQTNRRCYSRNTIIFFKYGSKEILKILINWMKKKCFGNRRLTSFLNCQYLTL